MSTCAASLIGLTYYRTCPVCHGQRCVEVPQDPYPSVMWVLCAACNGTGLQAYMLDPVVQTSGTEPPKEPPCSR